MPGENLLAGLLPQLPPIPGVGAPSAVELRRVARLFSRAGFGASKTELIAWATLGYAATVDHLLGFLPANLRLLDSPDLTFASTRQMTGQLNEAQAWWLQTMATTTHPLEEKLTLFWHGHFATANNKVDNIRLMLDQNRLFRDNAAGDFRKLCKLVTSDPAMLIWLDGQSNRVGGPNENYAREFMELFTLGRARFSQNDVRDAARALTGWVVNLSTNKANFVPAYHDNGVKVILGQAGNFAPADLTDIVLDRHPEGPVSSWFLATRMASFFHHPDPEPAVVSAMAQSLGAAAKGPRNVKNMLRTLFQRPEFMDGAGQTIRSPAELVAGTMRALQLQAQAGQLAAKMRGLGQDLFNPPNVGGWPGGAGWANSATALARYNFAAQAAAMARPDVVKSLVSLVTGPQEPVHASMDALGILELSSQTRGAIEKYVASAQGDGSDKVTRGILTLLIASPEYNLR
ncbi:MAG TPA: DUF1800 domain-containing protein [Candidatus Dormibacteraeota bacterium]|jgi:uncharacterized protein (DUF1800 family)|nr:DUF1800 domain-containing protein [Candidatus Dormibacteraeota bacterium]